MKENFIRISVLMTVAMYVYCLVKRTEIIWNVMCFIIVGKKAKGKKSKPLPGDKIAEMRGLDTDQMLSILIDYQLVVKVMLNQSIKNCDI